MSHGVDVTIIFIFQMRRLYIEQESLRNLPKITVLVGDRDLSVVPETVFRATTLCSPIQKSNTSYIKMQIFRFRDILLCDRGIYHIQKGGKDK